MNNVSGVYDQTHDKIDRFLRNFKDKSVLGGMHNVYFIQTTDIDGNVTGEAYAVNLMTNYGFKQLYTKGTANDVYNIFIGGGEGTPTLTNTSMFSPITTSGSVTSNTTKTSYPITYDKETGVITRRSRVYVGYFDYNITGIAEPRNITEIGYGISTTKLFTHSLIYDSEGNQTHIVKNINERLTISMIWAASIHKSVIEKLYDRKIYAFIDPAYFTELTRLGYSHDVYTNPEGGLYPKSAAQDDADYVSSGDLFESGIFDESDGSVTCTVTKTMSHIMYESPTFYMSYITFGKYSGSYHKKNGIGYSSPFYILTNERLSEPEEIVSDIIYTDTSDTPSLVRSFGLEKSYQLENADGNIPTTNFDIKSMKMYNHITKEWDIDEEFQNAPNADYTSNLIIINGKFYVYFRGTAISTKVSINTCQEFSITGFDNSGITIYATDEYWDVDTWEQIPNISSVPENLQNKRYYIKVDGEDQALRPIRNMPTHAIIPKKTYSMDDYRCSLVTSNNAYNLKPLSSDVNGWILTDKDLIYPQDDGSIVLHEILTQPNTPSSTKSSNPDFLNRWATDDRILVVPEMYSSSYLDLTCRSLRMYNVTGDSSVTPTYEDFTLQFSGTITTSNNYSFSDSGYLVIHNEGLKETIIFDIYGENGVPSQNGLTGTSYAHALNRSTYCVYMVPNSAPVRFEIYDMSSRSIVDTFTLPAEYKFDNGIGGWKDFVYVRVSNASVISTFLYRIDTKTLIHMPTFYSSAMSKITSQYGIDDDNRTDLSVDECYIVGDMLGTPTNANEFVYLFSASDPSTPIQLMEDNQYVYAFRSIANAQMKYVNDGKQLLLTYSQYRYHHTIDIGYILDNGALKYYPGERTKYIRTSGSWSNVYDYAASSGFFRGMVYLINHDKTVTWYPVEQLLPHKMTGTTTTIQAYNNPKRFGGKSYTIKLSNSIGKTLLEFDPDNM